MMIVVICHYQVNSDGWGKYVGDVSEPEVEFYIGVAVTDQDVQTDDCQLSDGQFQQLIATVRLEVRTELRLP